MSEHDTDAVVERIAKTLHSTKYSNTAWEELHDYERRHDLDAANRYLSALKPGDRLPGVDDNGQPITLVVVLGP